jgi:DNA-directed RNA polymerase subunit H (RpoH/RPB5)
MADEEIKETIGEEAPPVEDKQEETPVKPQEPSLEELAKKKLEEDLINLGKAKAEALDEISRIRKEKKLLKQGLNEEEELPKINMDDPSAKAWDKHIRETVQPVFVSDEKAREEVRGYAIQKFLQDKPALAKDSEKVKKLMEVYDRLHTASERTVEGVLTDLDMAYGAITYKEREAAEIQERIAKAEADAAFSDAAISRGATGYQSAKPITKKKLSEEEKQIVNQWERFGAPKIE